MSDPASLSSSIAARYAQALFELSREAEDIDTLEADADKLGAALRESDDFRSMVSSPLYGRDEQRAAVEALAGPLELSERTSKTLALMAVKRRLFTLPALVDRLRGLIADHRGEVSAKVTSAAPLSDAQREKLAETLGKRYGKSVKITTDVDEALIGGMVVKVGSTMIDTSIAAKLDNLQNAMKEVG